jgi:hypothetical protein
MSRPTLALLLLLGLTATAAAGPGKVLVLPLEGDADPGLRVKYSASVQRLARTLGGKVTAGDATFSDTATAIGCDPKTPACAEDVRATLGVDLLVYGTVSKENGKIVVVVHRVAKGKPRREVSATLEVTDAPERAEPELRPLFQEGAPPPTSGGTTGESPPTPEVQPPPMPPPAETPSAPNRTKVLGYAAAAGGGTLLLISFALWSSASGLEDDIAAHPVEDHDDFQALRGLESTARTRAWVGNALFLAGLAGVGLGGWIIYRDRKAQHTTVTPAPVPSGAALVLGGVF